MLRDFARMLSGRRQLGCVIQRVEKLLQKSFPSTPILNKFLKKYVTPIAHS